MIGLRRILKCQSGAAAVEFSIISVVLVMLLIGIVDFGRTLYVKNQLSFLADQAARSVLVDPNITDTALETALRTDFSGGDPVDLTVTISADTVGGVDFRVISIDYPITLFIPNLASSTLDLNVTRRMPAG
ncbi:MAG: TadE/TadG family type IV pilus assembly protein [Pseudomonadota bacterium]